MERLSNHLLNGQLVPRQQGARQARAHLGVPAVGPAVQGMELLAPAHTRVLARDIPRTVRVHLHNDLRSGAAQR